MNENWAVQTWVKTWDVWIVLVKSPTGYTHWEIKSLGAPSKEKVDAIIRLRARHGLVSSRAGRWGLQDDGHRGWSENARPRKLWRRGKGWELKKINKEIRRRLYLFYLLFIFYLCNKIYILSCDNTIAAIDI